MKKSKFLFGITALLASMVMMGCELELGDEGDRAVAAAADIISIASYHNNLSILTSDLEIIGDGEFVKDSTFGTVYKNGGNNNDKRKHALKLPETFYSAPAKSKELTVAFWVHQGTDAVLQWHPLLMAYEEEQKEGTNLTVGFFQELRFAVMGPSTTFDMSLGNNDDKYWKNYNDNKWHYYTLTLNESSAAIYWDGDVLYQTSGKDYSSLFASLSTFKYIYLGGMQATTWDDADTECLFAKISVWDKVLPASYIKTLATAN